VDTTATIHIVFALAY